MTDEELIKFIKNKVENSPYGYYKSIKPYKDRISKLFCIDTGNFKQNIYHLVNEISEIPVCEVCKNKNSVFRGILKGYGKTCSVQCAAKKGGDSRKDCRDVHVENMVKTNLERYGVKTPLERKEIKEKQEQTMLERYGAKHAVFSPILIEKTKNTINQRYGVDYWFESEESRKMSSLNMKEKRDNDFFKNYFQENYGVSSWYKTENGLRHLLKIRDSEFLMDDIEKYLNGDLITEISDKLNISPHMFKRVLDFKNIQYKPNYKVSSFENSVYELLKTFIDEKEIIRNDRKTLNGQEIDLFIPNKNIGIECNGIFWHSEEYKKKNYHKEKYILAENKGIQLLQITDLFYYSNTDKWKSVIKSKLGIIDNKIYARKCFVKEMSYDKDIRHFLDNNHLQGFSNASWYIGLFDENDTLLSIATFSKSRYNKQYNYELVRFCTLNNTTVIGGFSRLLSYFVKNHMKEGETILSYANCFWSNGNVYEKNNFEYVSHTDPNYIWTDSKKFLPRYKTQKHKLIEEYGADLVQSEVQFMTDVLSMKRYYDAGSKLYVYIK